MYEYERIRDVETLVEKIMKYGGSNHGTEPGK